MIERQIALRRFKHRRAGIATVTGRRVIESSLGTLLPVTTGELFHFDKVGPDSVFQGMDRYRPDENQYPAYIFFQRLRRDHRHAGAPEY